MSTKYSLDDFDYPLDISSIAQVPLQDKTQAKLLVVNRDLSFIHSHIYDLCNLIPKDSLIVVNNSRVIHSRLYGNLTTGGKIEVFLLEEITDNSKELSSQSTSNWIAIGKPGRKLKPGTVINFNEITATVISKEQNGDELSTFKISFNLSSSSFKSWLEENGRVPLPPYISRKNSNKELDDIDRRSYQTVYAKYDGSVAAPTAGLHFTDKLIDDLKLHGIQFGSISLHVGAGTFLPVTTKDIDKHVMHSERYLVPSKTLDLLYEFKTRKRPIIFVGTTTLRCLESFRLMCHDSWELMKKNCDSIHRTSLFIRPTDESYRYTPFFNTALMTNFHQPKSTLLMLVSSLVGLSNIKALYKEASQNNYRFFSYGDACLFWI